MKTQVLRFFAMVILLITVAFVSALASASAQTPGHNIRAAVPFEFNIGDQRLPAGEYSIGRLNSDGMQLRISNVDSNESANRLTSAVIASAPQAQTMLMFNRYGDRYFLSQVWTVGETTGRELRKSASERAMASELAKNKTAAETVTIAAMMH